MTGFAEIVSRTDFKQEEVLPLDTIREHTKTDDTPQVTDRQIELYRATAFEQAELYTGRVILGAATVQEAFKVDASVEGFRRKARRLKLTYLPMEQFVNIMEVGAGGRKQVPHKRNSRNLDLPNECFNLDITSCCRGGSGFDFDVKVQYRTGYNSKEDIPSTILYGCLKFITWAIANPGDELLTVRNRLGTTETGLIGTNNGAWASGAIEHWMSYKVN